jgi:hypothetical protein
MAALVVQGETASMAGTKAPLNTRAAILLMAALGGWTLVAASGKALLSILP